MKQSFQYIFLAIILITAPNLSAQDWFTKSPDLQTYYCSSGTISLSTVDSATAGKHVRPGFSVFFETNAFSSIQNSIIVYQNNTPVDTVQKGSIPNSATYRYTVDSINPSVDYKLKWGDEGKNDTINYTVYNHSDWTEIGSGTIIISGTKEFPTNPQITVRGLHRSGSNKIKGTGSFSTTATDGLTDYGNGYAVFDPKQAGEGTHTLTYLWKMYEGAQNQYSTSSIIVDGPQLTINQDNYYNEICEEEPLQLQVTAQEGDGNYSYAWNVISGSGTYNLNDDTIPGPVFSATSAPNKLIVYQVSVSDGYGQGCKYTSPVNIRIFVKDKPKINEEQTEVTDVTCYGENDGILEISASEGTGVLNYIQEATGDQFRNPTFTGLGPGDHTIIAKDSRNCRDTATFTIEEPQQIQILDIFPVDVVTCYDDAIGAVIINAFGGDGTLNYELENLETGSVLQSDEPAFNEIPGGDYRVTVTDESGCFQSGNVTVDRPEKLVIDENGVDVTHIESCAGEFEGALDIPASGGTGDKTYFATTDKDEPYQYPNNNLPAGTYYAAALDQNGCLAITDKQYTIEEPEPITLQPINNKYPTLNCHDSYNGEIIVSATGGTGTLDYVLSPESGDDIEDSDANPGVFTGLDAGRYTPIVTDENDCSVSGEQQVITKPDSINITAEAVDVPTCAGDNTGSIIANVTGGTSGYLYELTDESDEIVSSSRRKINQTTYTFRNLYAGDYYLKVTDKNNCVKDYEDPDGQFLFSPITVEEPDNVELDTVVTHVTGCYGDETGQISVLATGGTAPYEYSIDNGKSYTGTNTFSNLGAGTYYIKVRYNNKACFTNTLSVNITQPEEVILLDYTPVNIAECYGDSTGSITIEATGGTDSLKYSIDGGDTFGGNRVEAGKVVFDKLQGDVAFMPYVEDVNNCSDQWKDSVTLSQPDAITIQSVDAKDITTCYGENTGQLTIRAKGGTGSLSYSASTSDETDFQSSNRFSNLTAGTYNIVVKDKVGCTNSDSTATITQPEELTINNINKKDVTPCYGDSTGYILVDAEGGTDSLSYSNNNGKSYQENGNFTGLGQGLYGVVVKDDNNCTATREVTISQPTELIVNSISYEDIDLENGPLKGSISIDASGGSGELTYSLAGETESTSTTNSFDNLEPGEYIVSVEDTAGCDAGGDTIFIEQKNRIVLTQSTDYDITSGCYGDALGTAIVHARGYYEPLQYSIDDGKTYQEDSIFSDIKAGTYYVRLRDSLDYVFRGDSFTITQPEQLSIDTVIVSDVNTCYGDATGSIRINARGGTAPLFYSVDNGKNYVTNNTITGLSAGNYRVTIKDTLNCTLPNNQKQTVTISQPTKISIKNDDYTKQDIETCYGNKEGSITFLGPTGGTPPYFYSVNKGRNFSGDSIFKDLAAGNYNLVVKDKKNCIDSIRGIVEIIQPEQLLLDPLKTKVEQVKCHDDSTGTIKLSATGENPFLYQISAGGENYTTTTGSFNNLKAGSYKITIFDKNGCKFSVDTPAVVPNPPPIIIDTAETYKPSCEFREDGKFLLRAKGGTGDLTFIIGDNQYTEYEADEGFIEGYPPGEYIFRVVDENLCEARDTLVVLQSKFACIEVYNAFTPNGDGINDTWEIENLNQYPNAVIQIFNGWGKVLYEFSAGDSGWDGKYQGEPMPIDTYYYLIRLGDHHKAQTGAVYLVR